MAKIIIRIGLSLVATVFAPIPVWLFLGMRSMLSPEGFLQNFFVFGLGVWFLGGLQILLAIGWIFALFVIWSDK